MLFSESINWITNQFEKHINDTAAIEYLVRLVSENLRAAFMGTFGVPDPSVKFCENFKLQHGIEMWRLVQSKTNRNISNVTFKDGIQWKKGKFDAHVFWATYIIPSNDKVYVLIMNKNGSSLRAQLVCWPEFNKSEVDRPSKRQRLESRVRQYIGTSSANLFQTWSVQDPLLLDYVVEDSVVKELKQSMCFCSDMHDTDPAMIEHHKTHLHYSQIDRFQFNKLCDYTFKSTILLDNPVTEFNNGDLIIRAPNILLVLRDTNGSGSPFFPVVNGMNSPADTLVVLDHATPNAAAWARSRAKQFGENARPTTRDENNNRIVPKLKVLAARRTPPENRESVANFPESLVLQIQDTPAKPLARPDVPPLGVVSETLKSMLFGIEMSFWGPNRAHDRELGYGYVSNYVVLREPDITSDTALTLCLNAESVQDLKNKLNKLFD